MNKSILFALVALVVLGLVYWLGGDPSSRSTVQEGNLEAFQTLAELDDKTVHRITIAKGEGGPVELVREADDGWVIASSWNYQADTERVEDMLKSLRKIESPEVSGRAAANHPKFEVGKRKGAFIRLFDKGGQELAKLVVGKRAQSADFRENWAYLRFDGEDVTYKAQTDIVSKASLYSDVKAKTYLKKEVYTVPEGHEFISVRLERPDEEPLIVERRYRVKLEPEGPKEGEADGEPKEDEPAKEPEKEEYFVVTQGSSEPVEVDKEKWVARGLLDRMKIFSIDDVGDPEGSDYGLDKPQLIAKVSYVPKDDEAASPTTLTLSFGNAVKDDKGEDEGFWCRLDGAALPPHTYQVEDYDFKNWNKKLEDFLPKEEPEEGAASDGPPSIGDIGKVMAEEFWSMAAKSLGEDATKIAEKAQAEADRLSTPERPVTAQEILDLFMSSDEYAKEFQGKGLEAFVQAKEAELTAPKEAKATDEAEGGSASPPEGGAAPPDAGASPPSGGGEGPSGVGEGASAEPTPRA